MRSRQRCRRFGTGRNLAMKHVRHGLTEERSSMALQAMAPRSAAARARPATGDPSRMCSWRRCKRW
eukprot:13160610-Alexandrium_andersonii.AAC.1